MSHIKLVLLLFLGSAPWISQAATIQDARDQYHAGKLKPALSQANDLLEVNADSIPALFLKAQIQSESQRLDEAINTYKSLILIEPGHLQAHNNLAALYAQQGKLKLASETLEQAIRTDPVFKTIHINLRTIYMDMSQKHYRQALKLKAENNSTQIASIDIDGSADQILSEEVQVVPESIQASINTVVASKTPPKRAESSNVIREPEKIRTPAPIVAKGKRKDAVTNQKSRKPVVAAVTTPAGKPKVKTSSTPVPEPASNKAPEREVKIALLAWANAWSNRDAKKYVNAYSNTYATFGKTNKAWAAGRRWNFKNKKYIKVALSDIQIKADGDLYRASFKQRYESDTYRDVVNKELYFVRQSGRWKIAKEITS